MTARRSRSNAATRITARPHYAPLPPKGGRGIRGDCAEAGAVYGDLTAVRFADVRQNDFGPNIALWDFICECGEVCRYPLWQVKYGALRSCGHKREPDCVYVPPAEIDCFTAQHGRYESAPIGFINGVLDTDYCPTVYNRTHTLIDGWIDAGVFERHEIWVIEYTRDLWRDIPRPCNSVFEDPCDDDLDFEEERARSLLRNCANVVGSARWRIFENCVRWGEPGGYSGSKAIDNLNGQVAAAQTIVREVAAEISRASIL